MGFTSKLYPKEIIIDDTTPEHVYATPPGYSRGLELGRRTTPFGAMRASIPFPQELLIPESEWEARIKEREERKTRLSDLVDQAGLPCKDQNGTNYCWINAPVHCIEIMRVVQNQRPVILSPASCGAPIKNFRNVGGWGEEGLAWIAEHGVCPVEKWPANAIDRRYYTEDNKTLARRYRCTEWMELRPRNHAEMVSCLLLGFPVACGFNWWSHETTAYEPVWLDGEFGIRHRNSWGMNYGDRGYFVLRGSKKLADDAVSPRVVTAA